MMSSNSGDYNSGHYNSGHRNSGNYNSGNYNSGYRNSGHRNSGHCNSGHCNSGDYNSGDYNSGSHNSGSHNSGDCNSGHFNTQTPDKVMCFNTWVSFEEFSKADFPLFFLQVRPTVFVHEKDMTAEEKENHPEWETVGGYLKENDLKEEWRKAYQEASQEDKDKVKELPGFNAKVFEEITGINVDTEAKDCDGSTVVVNGVEYTLKRKGT